MAQLIANNTRAMIQIGAEPERVRRQFLSGNVFAREGAFYLLNPSLGSACFVNPFSPPPVGVAP